MQNIISQIYEKAQQALFLSFPETDKEKLYADVAPCAEENFGHYQCNSALRIAKILNISPRKAAEIIMANIEKDIFEKVEIAGPGFINFTLSGTFLSQELSKAMLDSHFGVEQAKNSPKTIVEFSSPNVAKELHVGHLRSTIIGDALARLFEFLGHDVLRLNHIGDWGTQFGMLIAYLKEFHSAVIQGEKADLTQLTAWYKKAKKLFDEDEDFKKRAQNEVVKLQGGEKSALKTWKIICDISRVAFEEIYTLLDVDIVERGESFYNPYLKAMIEELEKKGLITISDGAKCIFIEGFKNREGNPMPLMVQKSDGGFNYDTTDLAGFRHRCLEEHAQRIIIVTDAGQSLHFKLVYQAAILAKYLDPAKTRFDHVPFGLVLAPDGKKFKTRSGETERLIDLLHEAILRAKTILKERLPEDASQEELERTSSILGIDAIKYADLSCHRLKDYSFSYDRMLKFEGNTAPFLLYSYVRISSIKRKSGLDPEKLIKAGFGIKLNHPSELSLGLHLRRFGEILENMAIELLPNRLADYLYSLAEKFNAFFRDCRVLGSEEEKERLLLCHLTGQILKKGLEILGLKTVDRM